ncbi:MAG: tetratricopeptide repeat protein [Oligoflexales bacterium]|nr:tetratricopeptide repeat protein [Oligoflexales bacterium]
MNFIGKNIFFLFSVKFAAFAFFGGCATHYRFQSQPSEANVFYINGSEKTLIGQTPIDYAKSALPTDTPFVINFEKSGYEQKELSIAPSDNSLTTISVHLKPVLDAVTDATVKRMHDTIQQIFKVQELSSQQRYVDALSALQKLEEAEPTLAEVFVLRGSIYVMLNDKERAKQEWEKALKLAPHLESLKVQLARLTQDASKGSK